MAVVATVDFSIRADNSDIGADFTQYAAGFNGGASFKIVSGVAKPTSSSGDDSGEVYTGSTVAADHWNECTLNSSGSGGSGSGCGPGVRSTTFGTGGAGFGYYRSVANGAGWEVVEFGGNSFVGSLASGSGTTFTAGDTVYLEWQGSSGALKKNTSNGAGGTSVTSGISDATLNANIRCGVVYSTDDGANSGIRKMVIGDFTAAAATSGAVRPPRPQLISPRLPLNAKTLRRPAGAFQASTDLTLSLTGSAATFAAGTLTPSRTVALTGQSVTFSAGSMARSTTVGCTGSAATFAAGTLTPGIAPLLTGSVANFSTGTLTPSTTVGMSGQQATFSAGTMTTGSDVTIALTGSQATFSSGTLTASSDAVAPVSNSGGVWHMLDDYRYRRSQHRKMLEEQEEAARELQDTVDAEIAQLLLKQDKQQEFDSNLARLRAIASNYEDSQSKSELPERLQKAVSRAVARNSLSAYLKLQTEIDRAMEEEEVALMLLLNE